MVKIKQQTKLTKLIGENKHAVWAMLAAFIFSVFVLSTYKIEDDDFFWHLSTGKYIYENKVVPDKDFFSYPTENAEWIPFEWGWDLIAYGIYNVSNINTLIVINSLIFCLLFYVYFVLLRKFKVNSVLSIILLFLLLVAIFNRLSPRPHAVTYLFFTILLYLLVSLKYIDREKYLKRVLFLPLMFLFWGNLHPGVIAGLLFFLTFIINEMVIYYYPSKLSGKEFKPFEKIHLKKLILAFALSSAVLLINPHGLETYLYAYSHVKMKMLDYIAEWQNPFTGKIEGGIVITLYKLILSLGLIALIYAYNRKDLLFALIYIVFAVYSARAVRFNIDYEIFMMFFIAISINYFLIKMYKGKILMLFQGVAAKMVIIIFLIYVISQTFTDNIYLTLQYNRHFGFGINDSFIPDKMVGFMKENNIVGRTFNNYESGGYYLWTLFGHKNFIDSRNINDEVFNEYMSILNMSPGFVNKIEKYDFNNVQFFEPKLVKYPNMMRTQIPAFLSTNSKWKLVFWDDKSMLFLKDSPENADLINKYEYKIFNPYKAVFFQKEFENDIRNNPERTKAEMNRKAIDEPQGFFYQGMNEITMKVMKKIG